MQATVKRLIPASMVSPGQLHDAAIQAQDPITRMELQITHAEITEAMARFMDDPTTINLRKLNGHWAHGAHVLAFAARKARRRG
jgi:hypothetical protein